MRLRWEALGAALFLLLATAAATVGLPPSASSEDRLSASVALPPEWERLGGGIPPYLHAAAVDDATPFPNPPPQGGRGQVVHAAAADAQLTPLPRAHTDLFPSEKPPRDLNATPLPVAPPTAALPAPRVRAEGTVFPPTNTPAVPCADPRGCPDLFAIAQTMADNDVIITTFTPDDCSVQEGYALPGDNLLLRFTFAAGNAGPGDLIVGNPADHPEWFNFDTCHGHAHFKQYAAYRLWTTAGYQAWSNLRAANPDVMARDLLAAHPELVAQMVAGRKQGFCVVDLAALQITGVDRGPQRYITCTDQGISVSWADQYAKFLSGQWFDVTDVPNGTYVIEVETNAEHFFRETDYSNNRAATQVVLNPSGRPPTRTPARSPRPLQRRRPAATTPLPAAPPPGPS